MCHCHSDRRWVPVLDAWWSGRAAPLLKEVAQTQTAYQWAAKWDVSSHDTWDPFQLLPLTQRHISQQIDRNGSGDCTGNFFPRTHSSPAESVGDFRTFLHTGVCTVLLLERYCKRGCHHHVPKHYCRICRETDPRCQRCAMSLWTKYSCVRKTFQSSTTLNFGKMPRCYAGRLEKSIWSIDASAESLRYAYLVIPTDKIMRELWVDYAEVARKNLLYLRTLKDSDGLWRAGKTKQGGTGFNIHCGEFDAANSTSATEKNQKFCFLIQRHEPKGAKFDLIQYSQNHLLWNAEFLWKCRLNWCFPAFPRSSTEKTNTPTKPVVQRKSGRSWLVFTWRLGDTQRTQWLKATVSQSTNTWF